MRDFRSLRVWHAAHHLALAVYSHTEPFPRAERFGLTAQVRRSATSISANLAEGCGRHSVAEFRHFVSIAVGSCHETHAHLLIAHDLGWLAHDDALHLEDCIDSVRRQLLALHRHLSQLIRAESPPHRPSPTAHSL